MSSCLFLMFGAFSPQFTHGKLLLSMQSPCLRESPLSLNCGQKHEPGRLGPDRHPVTAWEGLDWKVVP